MLTEKKFKADNEKVNFPTQFYQASISKGYGATESREVSFKRNIFFSRFNVIDKSDILNILKYLMVKNNIR